MVLTSERLKDSWISAFSDRSPMVDEERMRARFGSVLVSSVFFNAVG